MRLFELSLLSILAAGSLAMVAWPTLGEEKRAPQNEELAQKPAWATNSSRVVLRESDAKAAADAHLMPLGTKSLLAKGMMRHGEFAWDDADVPAGKVTVWVDLRRQMVSAYRGPHEIGTSVILYGGPGHDTPRGTFPVLRKVADYHSRSYDAPMPHSLFITNDGVALHGSDVRIGRATHGCVGLPPEFARLLFKAVGVGDEITVVISDAGATEKLAKSTAVTID